MSANENPVQTGPSHPDAAPDHGAMAPSELLRLVCEQTLAVLRASAPGAELGAVDPSAVDPSAVDPGRAFRDLGLDSIGALALQARLAERTGLDLPPTLAFEHPTPAAVALVLATALGAPEESGPAPSRAVEGDPIAIVGIGCRFPGGVRSAEQLWRLVAGARHVLSDFPADRGWDLDALYDPDPDSPGTSYVRAGGFLPDAADFDAEFFGIGPREAAAMDPQQRLVLETAWEALEHAAIDPSVLAGTATGVFIGAETQEYGPRLHEAPEGLDGYLLTGNAASVLSGRVAYVLGLRGPSLTVDTACSGSLVALHLAVQSLRRGECDLALAGGVAVLASPGTFTAFSRQRGLAPDGVCKPFAAAADGTGFAEGVGVLVVQRLSDALRAGHEVLGVVRGSAVNSDGASNGLTAPSGRAQRAVIGTALADAGLAADGVDAVEGHGTGTRLGDPIEVRALMEAYGRDRERPLYLGSVKSNIGHTQAAAGAAGVIKMVMALRAGILPRTLHVDAPTPHVDWSSGAISLLTQAEPWPETGDRPRRAAVSSFGISGTNAHLILEQAPAAEPAAARAAHRVAPLVPLLICARGEAALRQRALDLLPLIESEHELSDPDGAAPPSLPDLGLSLAATRAALPRRAVILAGDRTSAATALRALAAGESGPRTLTGTAGTGGLAFLFTGQGAQYPAMGRDLRQAHRVFAEAFDDAAGYLDLQLERPLHDVVFGARSDDLERTDYAQCALFALEHALHRLLDSWGVRPDVLIGHSIGELAAAHAAGVWTLEDACAVVAARGRLMRELPAGGAMLAVAAGERRIAGLLGDRLDLAAVNGPESVVASGPRDAITDLANACAQAGLRTSRLRVSHAFHSRLVEPMLAEFGRVLHAVDYAPPTLPIISTLTGRLASAAELCTPDYWVRQAREGVRFADAVDAAARRGATRWLEIGPDAVLSAAARVCRTEPGEAMPEPERECECEFEPEDEVFVATLRRPRGDADSGDESALAAALGALCVRGVNVDWAAYLADSGARRVALPTYPFQRRRFWLDPTPRRDAADLGQEAGGHPLLTAVVRFAHTDGLILTGRVARQAQPWLDGHRIAGQMLLPATSFLEMALYAASLTGLGAVAELRLHAPLVLPETGGVAIQAVIGAPDPDGGREITFHAAAEGDSGGAIWTRHAAGRLAPAAAYPQPAAGPDPGADLAALAAWPPADAEPVDLTHHYGDLAAHGYGYGPAFRGLRSVWRRGAEVFAEAVLPPEARPAAGGTPGTLHPALLDAVLQATDFAPGEARDPAEIRLPFLWAGVTLHAEGASALRARIRSHPEGGVALDLADQAGTPVATVRTFRSVPAPALRDASAAPTLHRVAWVPVPSPAPLPDRTTAATAVLAGPTASLPLTDLHPTHPDLGALLAAGPLPPVVLLPAMCPADLAEDLPRAARLVTAHVLSTLQPWLTDQRFANSRLVVVTAGVSEPSSEAALAAAPVAGLVRSVQAEHPGRVQFLDVLDPALNPALAVAAAALDEPELRIVGGVLSAPRLLAPSALTPPSASTSADPWAASADPAGDGWVLITGGTGALGALTARHLAAVHGVRRLLLVGRRGPAAPGAGHIAADLAQLGATAVIEACDISDRAALTALLARHRVRAAVHAAGALDDALLSGLTPERFETALRPKLDAAWLLHELTADLDLDAFVLYSSAAGLVDGSGQGNYAAGNTFLDALAAHRRARGLPATALAWGLWSDAGGMGATLGPADLRRIARLGLVPLTAAENLAAFDAALSLDAPALVPVRVDRTALARRADGVPAMLRSLVPAPRTAVSAAGTASPGAVAAAVAASSAPAGRALAALPEADRSSAVLDLVRTHVAAVLGYDGPADVAPRRAFTDLGVDSLAAVDLRNALTAATGLRLPATVTFDHPTAAALAAHVLALLAGRLAAPTVPTAAAAPHTPDEPIAIVGMACRYPGGVDSPEALWRLVAAGADAITPFPQDRGWDAAALYDPTPGTPGRSYTREGGFLHDAAQFDPGFFGIGPREALAMDPQQRLLLETAWEAVERAGIDPLTLRGTPTGVFAGVMYHDWGTRLGAVPEDVAGYLGNGSLASVVSGRVSYVLGLEGPAVTVDTACSSSLVALHWAAEALRRGECTLALAGGVTVMSTPDTFVDFSRQQGLAADGRCKSFAEAADGTGWGEGAGVLLLERLSDARRAGHRVLAVVRGSAVNHDGASNGLTAPSGPAQQRVIGAALAAAGLNPADVDAVEGHGTGTRLGDPIEAQALLAAYGADRPAGRPLLLGSIKSNIGHTQAAAGAAGVIKMVMALRHELLPATLHVDAPSSHVDWSGGAVRLLARAQPWTRADRPRRAAISSFGISGTNAHVIIEEVDEALAAAAASCALPPAAAGPHPLPFVLSGRGRPALRARAAQLLAFMEQHPDLALTDLAPALAASRAGLEQRAAVLAADQAALLRGLSALSTDSSDPAVFTDSAVEGRLAFLFSGQGTQRPGMGAALYAAFPVFARTFDETANALAAAGGGPATGPTLREVAFGDDADLLNRTDNAQSALFAFQVALFRLLESLGVRPDLLAGHSIGELAAAHVAGIFDLDDACALVAARGRLMAALPGGEGAMLSLALSEAEAAGLIAGHEDLVGIAAVNGPASVVLSGDRDTVTSLAASVPAAADARALRVSHAFHSPLMEPMLDEFRAVAAAVRYLPPRIPIVSALTGRQASGADPRTADHWVRHVRETVRFGAAVEELAERGTTTFLEIGPDSTLCSLGAANAPDAAFVPCARRGREEPGELFGALARLHLRGCAVSWPTVLGRAAPLDLPTYPFQRERYWLDAAPAADAAGVGQVAAGHPLLGAVVPLPGAHALALTGHLSARSQPWLADHVVGGRVLMPGTGLLELAFRAAGQVGCPTVAELTLHAPMSLPDEGLAVHVAVGPDTDGRRAIEIYGRPADAPSDGTWTRHATGVLTAQPAVEPAGLTEWPPPGAERIDLADAYQRLEARGYGYGPAFQGLRAAWRRDREIFAEVALAPAQAAQAGDFGLHPALLDTAMHADLLEEDPDADETLLPFSWSAATLHAVGAAELRVRIIRRDGARLSAIEVADAAGRPVAVIGSLASRPVAAEAADAAGQTGTARLLRVERRALGDAVRRDRPRDWALIGAEPGGRGPRADARPADLAADSSSTTQVTVHGSLHLPETAFTDIADLRAALGRGLQAPAVAVLGLEPAAGTDADTIAEAHAFAEQVRVTLHGWLADPRLAGSRLAVVIRSGQLAHSPVTGLLRAAQAEHPGRFTLVSADDSASGLLPAALDADEPEVEIRAGALSAPRYADAPEPTADAANPWNPEGTVLITGGPGGLAGQLALHLAATHSVRHILFAGRRGARAPGAEALTAELSALGAQVEFEACDVADRAALARLLAGIEPEHPLTAVIHAAAVVDPAVTAALTAAQLTAALRPKLDAAWHLHELTLDLKPAAFVLYSSSGGHVMAAGQGNYAAANTFLDALAAHRHGLGLPASALAWGLWDHDTGLGGPLAAVDLRRAARLGLPAISVEEGLRLFDRAIGSPEPVLAPLRVDPATLRSCTGDLPALLRGLVPATRRAARPGPAADGSALARRLAALTGPDQDQALHDLVARHVAAVLGLDSAAAVDPERAFKDLGIDSLAAVELRNLLGGATGLALPATLVFDHPTANAVVAMLKNRLLGQTGIGVGPDNATAGPAFSSEPIAIVGMACRYPGSVRGPADLWDLLVGEVDAVSGFPANRGWDTEGVYHPERGRRGKSYAREGGFLHDAAQFDPGFFGIGPREALAMDPQQRLLLETAWEAVERAGIDPHALRGTPTGVYVGSMYDDYGSRLKDAPADVAGYLANGSSGAVVSGRISYLFGFEGPSMTVDTACSSSLVTVHLAAQALRAGECTLALAGGVTVLSSTDLFVDSSRQGVLAPDGRSKSFAAAADGVGWAEGAGLVLLERLSDARRRGHRVLAVVRGSAVNQDGASNGLTAPNGPSQERVIRAALAASGLRPADVDAVEAHGSGTRLGDPIEAQALLATYGADRPDERPLLLGSVKSNIGHAQAAGGVAAVIKVVLALGHSLLPRTLHVDAPSPHVDWSSGGVRLLTRAQPWIAAGRPRRAGISSFGISGTNAHVIVEEAPAAPLPVGAAPPIAAAAAAVAAPSLPVQPLLVSGATRDALRTQAARLTARLAAPGAPGLADAAYALAVSRAALDHRAAVLAGDPDTALRALRALAAGRDHPALLRGPLRRTGRTAALFTGQGSQHRGMGRALHGAFPVFAAAFDQVCDRLEPLLALPLREVMWRPDAGADTDPLNQTAAAQGALFAFEVALYRLFESLGVRPDLVAGHSIGELAAAHVAGVFDLDDACALVAARGRLMQALPATDPSSEADAPDAGVMVSIRAAEDAVRAAIAADAADFAVGAGHGDPIVDVAAVNGPEAVVISGHAAAVARVAARFAKTRRLRVSHAFHCALMEPMLDQFAAVAATVDYRPPTIPIVSNVTGRLASTEELCTADYWVRHVRETVRFAQGVAALEEAGAVRFLEIGPGAVLTAMARDCVRSADALLVASTRDGRDEAETVISAVAELHVHGVRVDWSAMFAGRGARIVDLPTYAFQNKEYWLNAGAAAVEGTADHVAEPSAGAHPLLGAAVELPDTGGAVLTGTLALDRQTWLADHLVHGAAIVPGAVFAELALRAGAECGHPLVEELVQHEPLILPARGAVDVRVVVGGLDDSGLRPFSVHARIAGAAGEGLGGARGGASKAAPWTLHARGFLARAPQSTAEPDAAEPYAAGPYAAEPFAAEPDATLSGTWPPPGAEPVDLTGVYDALAGLGFGYGPVFQGMRAIWRREGEIFGEVALPESAVGPAANFALHPALLDAALGVTDFLSPGGVAALAEATIPFAWNRLAITGPGAAALRVRAHAASGGVGLVFADAAGRPVGRIEALATRPVTAAQLAAARPANDSLLRIGWHPAPNIAADPVDTTGWVLVGDPDCVPGLNLAAVADAAALEALVSGGTMPNAAATDAASVDAAMADVAMAKTAMANAATAHAATAHAAVPGAAMAAAVSPFAPAPATVVIATATPPGPTPAAVRTALDHTLSALRTCLTSDHLAATRIIVLTTRAFAIPGDSASAPGPDPVQAALSGLVRAAQAEHPGRILLIDTDGRPVSLRAVPALAAAGKPEPEPEPEPTPAPEFAVRAGQARLPRLERCSPSGTAPAWRPDGTVLITGGTGLLGGLLAEHLAAEHGVRRLLLTSRRGASAPGADALIHKLAALGAHATVAACDVADRDALAALLAAVPAEHPLTGVVHAAGLLDSTVLTELTPARMEAVLRPKVDAAWYLHELTAGLDLAAFVLYSSAGGIVLPAGQGNYAAANTFLDGLAGYRAATGLPALSLAWGPWQGSEEQVDLTRAARGGIAPLAHAEALALFDAALRSPDPVTAALRLDSQAADPAAVAPLLRGLIHPPRQRSSVGTVAAMGVSASTSTAGASSTDPKTWRTRLNGLDSEGRADLLFALVVDQTAAVLGYEDGSEIDPDKGFTDLGIDSLAAVELRNRLGERCGLRLSATLVFDYASPAALAGHLFGLIGPPDDSPTSAGNTEESATGIGTGPSNGTANQPSANLSADPGPDPNLALEPDLLREQIESMDLDALMKAVYGEGGGPQ